MRSPAFEGEPAGFVVSGRLSTKIENDWVATPWLVKGNQYRAEEQTRVLFDHGVKVMLMPGAEFKVGKERRVLQPTGGRLVAELPGGDDYSLALGAGCSGPRRPWARQTGCRRHRLRGPVIAEQGGVWCEGATAEPSSEANPAYFRVLHQGVEYRLADGKLLGQKERTLLRLDRPE